MQAGTGAKEKHGLSSYNVHQSMLVVQGRSFSCHAATTHWAAILGCLFCLLSCLGLSNHTVAALIMLFCPPPRLLGWAVQ